MNVIKKAFIKTLPVLTGYIVLGIGFGILMQKNGFGAGWVFAMSACIYAGSMQYVGINLMTCGATVIATALTTFMVNARHLFYGISMIDRYKGTGARKPYLIFALTDETYSLVCTGEGPDGVRKDEDGKNEDGKYKDSSGEGSMVTGSMVTGSLVNYQFWISLLNQLYWITGSLLGYYLGMIIPFDTTGIDFSMTALFVTVFVQQWMDTKNHLPAIIGLLVSVICLVIFGSERFLIPTMIFITLILSVGRRFMEGGIGE